MPIYMCIKASFTTNLFAYVFDIVSVTHLYAYRTYINDNLMNSLDSSDQQVS